MCYRAEVEGGRVRVALPVGQRRLVLLLLRPRAAIRFRVPLHPKRQVVTVEGASSEIVVGSGSAPNMRPNALM